MFVEPQDDGTTIEFDVLGHVPGPVRDALNDAAWRLAEGSHARLVIEKWMRLMDDDVFWSESVDLPEATK